MPHQRVLMLSAHYGRIDRRIVAEANALVESGRDVTIASVPTDFSGMALDPRVNVHCGQTATTARKASLKSIIRQTVPKPVYEWAHWRLKRYRTANRFTSYFLDSIPNHRADVVHCHNLDTLPAATRIAKSTGAKLVYDAHELFPFQETDRGFQSYWEQQEQQHIGGCDAVIAVNRTMALELSRRYQIGEPVVIHNSGEVPQTAKLPEAEFLAHFSPSVEPARFAGCFKVLFQGSLNPLRNLDNLVRSFGRLDDSFQLFLLGDGLLRNELASSIRRLGLSNVHLGDWVPQESLPAYTPHADLGMIPYESPKDLLNMRCCSPNKLFEYMAADVPMCVSDLPELRRTVERFELGGVYEMQSADQIATAIRDCRSRIERGEFPQNRRHEALAEFGWPTQRDRLLALYDTLSR